MTTTVAEHGVLPIRRALLSVSDKTGIAELGATLVAAGVELLSTGGTYKALVAAGLAVTEVSAHTGSPEIMDGRVKTLHPKIHGGILGRRGVDDAVMAEHDIAPIDLVVVNLYPFRDTIARADCTDELAIENIDIGGPTMVRAAAKNHAFVWVVVNPSDYPDVIAAVNDAGSSFSVRRRAALQAYQHTASYDSAVANYLVQSELATCTSEQQDSIELALPESYTLSFAKRMDMRYGENPHQLSLIHI